MSSQLKEERLQPKYLVRERWEEFPDLILHACDDNLMPLRQFVVDKTAPNSSLTGSVNPVTNEQRCYGFKGKAANSTLQME